MRRFIMLLLAAVMALGVCGCAFFMDAEHNRGHWEIIRADLREWHSDMDFLLGLDEPTLLETHYR
jgi:hypothetical protein